MRPSRFHSHIALTTASLGGDSQDLPAPHCPVSVPGVAPGSIAVRCEGSSAARWQKPSGSRGACAAVWAPSHPRMPRQRQYSETGGRGPRSSAARVSTGFASLSRDQGWKWRGPPALPHVNPPQESGSAGRSTHMAGQQPTAANLQNSRF